MDWLTFISNLVDSLAWPVTALLALLLLRRPLAQLLPEMRKVKYKDFEAEFGREVEQLREKVVEAIEPAPAASPAGGQKAAHLHEVADFAPNAAVLEAWKAVEAAAKRLITARGHDLDYDVATPYRLIEQVLRKSGLIDERKVKIYNELRRLRNKVAHAGDYELSRAQAQEYIQLAVALSQYLDGEAGADGEERSRGSGS